MQVIINGNLAAVKSGTSFEYVSENRLFGGGDDYTFAITLPLAGCAENQKIFGHINRADVDANKTRFDCEIRCKNFVKFGTATITEITEKEVKIQFLAGRSEQNFDDTWEDVYINELDLGAPPSTSPTTFTPARAWEPNTTDTKCVALPWVNDYSRNIQNLAENVVDDADLGTSHFEWNKDTKGLSWQPYLLHITKKICEAVGYTADLSAWSSQEELKYLLICNTLPYAWDMPEFAKALPHWTVEEYFQKLELFLGGEFDIDHRAKRISFGFTKDILTAKGTIGLKNVVDEHTTTVSEEDNKCEYQEAKNLVYKDCDHEMWKFYSCDWFIKAKKSQVVHYATLRDLIQHISAYKTWDGLRRRGSNIDKVYYAADCNAYFIIHAIYGQLVWGSTIHPEYTCQLQPLNLFGGRIVDDTEDAEQEEIEFVPAWIDQTEEKYGNILFLSCSNYDEDPQQTTEEDKLIVMLQPRSVEALEAGEKDKVSEYFDRIYIGWYNGTNSFLGTHLPHPEVENIAISDDWNQFAFRHFSLRLNDTKSQKRKIIHKIDTKSKSTFKFIADTMPDVRAVFLIRGKRYICEKITATISDDGMSQLFKGEFWPLLV